MLNVVNYTFKPHMSKDEVKELLEAFAAIGSMPGTIAHYLWTDGRGGTVVSETDDVTGTYRNLLSYTEWLEFDHKVALPVEEAVAQVMDYVG